VNFEEVPVESSRILGQFVDHDHLSHCHLRVRCAD
jgi:hypothetical protein